MCFVPEEKYRFQSTLPVRGATYRYLTHQDNPEFQSTLPVRGATRTSPPPGAVTRISIHAPREGSDVETITRTGREQ